MKIQPIKKKKQPPRTKLTTKQEGFVNELMITKNATEAASRVYNTKNRVVAGAIGTENLRKPLIQAELQDRLQIAKDNIFKLANKAKSENVRLSANQDIVDRHEGKPTQTIKQTTLNVDVEGMDMEELLKVIKTN